LSSGGKININPKSGTVSVKISREKRFDSGLDFFDFQRKIIIVSKIIAEIMRVGLGNVAAEKSSVNFLIRSPMRIKNGNLPSKDSLLP